MKRWLCLVLLLAPCNGCMLFDDMIHDEPPYARVQAPTGGCGVPAGNVNAAQTAEPELAQSRR